MPTPLPYPTRNGYQLKAIQPDFWPDKANISGNMAGGVAVNLGWWIWEPSPKAPPCNSGQIEFLDRCYSVDGGVEDQIKGYTDRGLRVTGVLYGSPPWARAGLGAACTPASAGFEIFCKPDDPSLFGRFAGMLAHRYNGLNGHGRVVDFVIWNEVNSNDWFDIGCGQGTACSTSAWLNAYAALWNSAYDHIITQQPTAKVFYSFEHHFASSYDAPSASHPVLGVETFITGMASRVGNRTWRVAYHPYPPNLLSPTFGAYDWPRITYGNIGVLAGWLWKHYPNSAAAHDIHLTESGVNSLSPQSSQAAQAQGVCDGFVNILGTPGIDNYVYHRMKDHPAETAGGLGLGLHDDSGQPKQAWAVWALANRYDLSPPQLSCGFQHLPYTYLKRGYKAGKGHWATSRALPSGFALEQDWRLLRDKASGTTLLFACKVGDHNLLTKDSNCENQFPMGPVGWIYNANASGRVPLYRCYIPSSGDHFVSSSATCEGQTVEQLLGYALP
ncbi:MAG: hypothetical protein EP329_01690 [Deltaproteobacteria bacterium]|nr:MAG: hypothetical protein EP329_01690 [Deltaproteobacteria bacterium]